MMGRREILTMDELLPTWDGRDIADLLDLATIAPNRFRSRFAERNEHGRIYGGQMLGHAVAAASLMSVASSKVRPAISHRA